MHQPGRTTTNAGNYLIAVIAMLWIFSLSVQAEEPILPAAATANVSDDFNDGDFDGWTVDSEGGWEVKDGVMQISKSVNYNWENWLTYYAKYDAGEINGDFTLTLDIGFNIDACSREETSLYYPDPTTVVGTDSIFDDYRGLQKELRLRDNERSK